MSEYYKSIENITLQQFHFRSNIQRDGQTFIACCNRVFLEAKHCSFKCASANCPAEDNAMGDQIVIGTKDNDIHQETLKRSWDLKTLKQEDMNIARADRVAAEINGDDIYIMGTYPFKSMKNKRIQREDHQEDKSHKETSITCYNCGNKTNFLVKKHKLNCPAQTSRCYNCNRIGHFRKFCKSTKDVRKVDEKKRRNYFSKGIAKDTLDRYYNVSLFRITTPHVFKKNHSSDFKVEVVINNTLGTVIMILEPKSVFLVYSKQRN